MLRKRKKNRNIRIQQFIFIEDSNQKHVGQAELRDEENIADGCKANKLFFKVVKGRSGAKVTVGPKAAVTE